MSGKSREVCSYRRVDQLLTAECRAATYRAAVSARNLLVVPANRHERTDIGPGDPIIYGDFNYSAVITRLNVEPMVEI